MTRPGQDIEERPSQPALTRAVEAPTIEALRPVLVPLATVRDAVPATGGGSPSATTGRARLWRRAYGRRLLVTDVLIVSAALATTQIVSVGDSALVLGGSSGLSIHVPSLVVTVVLGLLWVASLAFAGSRENTVIGAGGDEYKRVIDGTMRLFGTAAILLLLTQATGVHGYFLLSLPLGLVLLILGRWMSRKWLVRQRRSGHHLTRAVLVGDWHATDHVIDQLAQDTSSGLVLVGAVTRRSDSTCVELASGVPVLGSYDDLFEGLVRCGADAVIYTGAAEFGPRRLRELGWRLDELGVDLIVAPALTDIAGPRIHAKPVAGVPLVRVDYPRFDGSRRIAKRALDIVASSLALLLLAPIFVVIAGLIRLDSSGPAVFRQTRVGLNGEPFRMLKFRSMVADAESRLGALAKLSDGNGVLFKMRQDPRVTRLGRPLRRYSLDELPQLVNVLRGEMSLVGPRPPLTCEVEQYDPWAHRRFLVKPGLTGPWQIRGRSDLCWDDTVRLDLYYVENWSLMGDLLILWKTVRVLVRPTGAY